MLRHQLILFLFLFFGVRAQAQSSPLLGVDCNYALEMARRGQTWKVGTKPVDPIQLFAEQGCRLARIRLWVGDTGVSKLDEATETALRAQRAGLQPFLVIFLSEDWADMVKQPAPAAWREISLEAKAAAVEAYTERIVSRMREQGVSLELFEIGNEIDFGICGEFEEEWPKRVSLEYMQQRIWPRMTPILKAAQAGVLKVQPKAKFVIHLAQWNKPDYCLAFWKHQRQAGVRVDVPGLSYFPTSSKEPEERSLRYLQTQVDRIHSELGSPVLICETAYPATADFGGQFADWKHAVEGYPLSEEGQALWVVDLARMVRSSRSFAGAVYWSPEWYGGGLWDAFALFDSQGVARPGVRSFRP